MLDCTVAYGLSFLFPAKDNAVGASLRLWGEFARPELDFLVASATDAEGAFIDVGANIGAIALPFAQQRPQWRVIAVEAHRGIAGILAANALNNRLFNVDVLHAAAGAQPGLAGFPTPPLSQSGNFGVLGFGLTGAESETVRVLTLDEIAPADTRLVKIDVEGFEPEVLAGARRLLEQRSAVWVAEAARDDHAARARVITTFLDAGYAVHWFYAPFATPAAEKGATPEPGMGDANLVAVPPGAQAVWDLATVRGPQDRRPGEAKAYPYLARYGYPLA